MAPQLTRRNGPRARDARSWMARAITSLPEPQDERWRVWRSADGRFSVEARYIDALVGIVTLERRDGTRIEVNIDALSEEDREYVRKARGY